ncbi:MAG: sigma-54-dependent Fis family transcriptional regulator [Gemmatimonadetes bacterium]|nr:sigma-54-dependent Fis family transcriptional regulator [Gemmatimonadota bacterium]
METGHILIVDDEPEMLENCRRLLTREGHRCTTLAEAAEFPRVLRESRPDVVLCDLRMPAADGMKLLAVAHSEDAEIPFIIITAYATVSSAVNAIQEGAFDYLAKPFTAQQLNVAVKRALRQRRLAEENRDLRDQVALQQGFGEILGQSPAMRRVMERIRKAAPTDANVLISGESGTGKELVARHLHANSPRKTGPFVPVDCAAIPETLLESTLFGHEKGAFTGAVARQHGLLEQADRGTLFLDEITELSPHLQSRLLRALQEREVRRVGAGATIALDIRVVAATHLDPAAAVAGGRLREDLYYRLNVIPIALPPLRERGSDAVLLFQTFLRRFADGYGKEIPRVTRAAWDAIESYAWPGNVRELKNAAERLFLLDDDGSITLADLPEPLAHPAALAGRDAAPRSDLPYRRAREHALRAFEAHYLEQILQRHGGNVTRAAQAAGVSRRTLHRWLERLRSPKREDGA